MPLVDKIPDFQRYEAARIVATPDGSEPPYYRIFEIYFEGYPTDLSDAEWECLKPHLPAAKELGRPRIHGSRHILDAVFYILRSGCAWRLLPREFPPWRTVYHYSLGNGASTVLSNSLTRHCEHGYKAA